MAGAGGPDCPAGAVMRGAPVAPPNSGPPANSDVEYRDLRPYELGQTLMHLHKELARARICAEKHQLNGNHGQYEAFRREIQALGDRIDELDPGSAERSH